MNWQANFRELPGLRKPILAAAGFFLMNPQTGLAAENCPNDPPLQQVRSEAHYADSHGSIIDPVKLHESMVEIMPLRRFVTDASERADSSSRADQQCAYEMMLSWAKAGAMTEKPATPPGNRSQERFTIALNIIALKLKAQGFDMSPLRGWLDKINMLVIDVFERHPVVDNLGVWSGVAAASYAAVSGNADAKRYADSVWGRAIANVRPDGFVDTELRRAGRALGYHAYYLSALVTLHAFRNALGEPLTASERSAIKRLADRVNSSLCDHSAMAQAAGAEQQTENLRPIEFSPIVTFDKDLGLGEPITGRCTPEGVPSTDPILGGNFARTAAMLAQLQRH